MGEAKRRRENAKPTVYHHTSTLRTNLIWMSGVIQVEGAGKPAIHPLLGEIRTDALSRRKMTDFPPVAWFTTRLEIPKCLIESSFFIVKETGEIEEIKIDEQTVNLISLHRVALGFVIEDIDLTPWPEYYGYSTPEGRELNEVAQAAGDNPDDWYISEVPIDVLRVSEFYSSRTKLKPKLERMPSYIEDIKRMVVQCRENNAYIPPSWLSRAEAILLAQKAGVPVYE